MEVLAAGVADQTRRVDEADRGPPNVARVAVAEGKSGVGDEVGEAVRAAEETLVAVLLEAGVGAVNGGLEGDGGGRAGLVVLEALLESLDGVLVALGEGLGVLAGGETGDVSLGGVDDTDREDCAGNGGQRGQGRWGTGKQAWRTGIARRSRGEISTRDLGLDSN